MVLVGAFLECESSFIEFEFPEVLSSSFYFINYRD